MTSAPESGRARPSSASSASATSACRWPAPSPSGASPSSASTSTPPRSRGSARGESYIGHIGDDADPRDAGRRPVRRHRRLRPPRRGRRRHHLRADAADRAREPDLSLRRSPRPAPIAARLRPGQLVVLESTTYPGTTRDVVLPILEASGLVAGRDFFLAFSPEREDPGNPIFSAPTIPKVVGGLDPASLELAVDALRPRRRPRRAGLHARGRRGVQDPREHLSGREHRPGQRAEGPLRPDGHRRLGGDRRGQDQAVRLPGVLPRPRPGRATASRSTRST